MRHLAAQGAALGSMHGAVVGMVVVTFVQPESLLGELAASSAWLKAQGAAAALVERMSAEAVGLIAATEKPAVDGEVIAAESAAVGRSATTLLKSTGVNDFSKLDGPQMQEFAEALGTEKAAGTVALAARTLVAELRTCAARSPPTPRCASGSQAPTRWSRLWCSARCPAWDAPPSKPPP